jgi:hypothetical protein
MKYIGKYFSAERFSTYYCMLKCKYTVYCIYIVYWIKYSRETTDLPLVTNQLYHIMLYRVHLDMSGIQTHNFGGDRHLLHRLLHHIYVSAIFLKVIKQTIYQNPNVDIMLWFLHIESIMDIVVNPLVIHTLKLNMMLWCVSHVD